MAAAQGSSEVMDVLIKKGANLIHTNREGNNFVHLMASHDNAYALKVSGHIQISLNEC